MNPSDEAPESYTNGQTYPVRPQSSLQPPKPKPRPKKAPELPTLERRNWLIHTHYVRREFEMCKVIIRSQLEETHGMCEYANHVQGLILRQEGKIQESLEMFQICNILNPNSAEYIKQMARSLFLLGRHKLAIEAYRQAEARSQKPDWEICHNMGICLMYLKDFEEAKCEITRALSYHKNDQSFIALGKISLLQGDLPRAIDIFKQGIIYSPENPELCTTLGLIFMQISQHQMAFEQLGTAMAFDPNFTKAIMAAGSMMQSHHDYDVALAKYRSAANGELAESPQLWNNIGMCFFSKKKYVASISCLKRASYLAPFDWKILYNLGMVHLTMQQFASAFHFLSAAINLRPTRGQTFMLLAVALTHLADPDNAKVAYDQAMHLDIKDPAIPLNYAVFMHNRKLPEEASKQLANFEIRVKKLRQTPGLDADPDILSAALGLSSEVGYTLNLAIAEDPGVRRGASGATVNHPRGSASVRSARASAKAQLKAEGRKIIEDEVPILEAQRPDDGRNS